MSRPSASVLDEAQPPALPMLAKTSRGPYSSSFMMTKSLPQPVSMRCGLAGEELRPRRARGGDAGPGSPLLDRLADVEDLLLAAAVAVDGHALAAASCRPAGTPSRRRRRSPSLAKLTVLDTALSVCFWKAACIRMCHSGVMSWAVAKTCLHVVGDTVECRARCRSRRSASISSSL